LLMTVAHRFNRSFTARLHMHNEASGQLVHQATVFGI
jgi:hypothetical protein